MKKLYAFLFLSLNSFVFSQSYYSSNYERTLRLDDAENFYFIEWELNPADFPNKLSDIEALKKLKTIPNTDYVISRNKSVTTVEVSVNGQRFSESNYKNGLLDGTKTIFYDNGSPFQQFEFKNGKANGVAKLYGDNYTIILETTYKDNLKNGLRKYLNPRRNELVVEGNYNNGKLVGDLKIYFNENTTISYSYPNDLKKGTVKRFYDNKLVSEYSIYDTNQINGDYKTYNPATGKVIQISHYTYGKIDGFEELYNAQGELLNKVQYRLGNKIGVHKKYSDDKKNYLPKNTMTILAYEQELGKSTTKTKK